MKTKLFLTMIFVFLTTTLYARPFLFPIIIPIKVDNSSDDKVTNTNYERKYNKPNSNDILFSSSYMIPVDNSLLNSYLSLSISYEFWGIFELVGGTYIEIDDSEEDFFNMFQTPEALTFGVGVDIPLGGLSFKADYQRLINYSDFDNQYKLGVGFNISNDVELEFYNRTFFSYDETLHEYDTETFIGAGFIFTIN